jgi:hypothetical protein
LAGFGGTGARTSAQFTGLPAAGIDRAQWMRRKMLIGLIRGRNEVALTRASAISTHVAEVQGLPDRPISSGQVKG